MSKAIPTKLMLTSIVNTVIAAIVFFCSVIHVHAETITVKSTPESQCLSIIPGDSTQLKYPLDALERQDGGIVHVEMQFTSPKSSPSVKILEVTPVELVQAVTDYVYRYRLPCMNPGDSPQIIRQSYRFDPSATGVIVNTLLEPDENAALDPQLACMRNINGQSRPFFPSDLSAWDEIRQVGVANYYYKVTFVSPEQPPELEWIVAKPLKQFKNSIMLYAKGLRLPCLTNGPVSTKLAFSFSVDQGKKTLIKDMSLQQFLGVARVVPSPVSFDLDSMECPFKLRITYRQPYERNNINEYDKSVPSRKAFVTWLSKITIAFNENDNINVFQSVFTLDVPCGTVNL